MLLDHHTNHSPVSTKKHFCDEQVVPEWGTGPDGRPVKISGDIRLPILFAEWERDACDHPHSIITCEPDSLGRDQYFERCDQCGLKLTSAIAHGAAKARGVSEITRDRIEAVAQQYVARRRRALDKISKDAAERCQPENRQSYDDYLRSPEWRRRASKIMQRANGVCEGCLTNDATEVHHLTYENVGAEFAFELVALCSPCHRRLHDRKAA